MLECLTSTRKVDYGLQSLRHIFGPNEWFMFMITSLVNAGKLDMESEYQFNMKIRDGHPGEIEILEVLIDPSKKGMLTLVQNSRGVFLTTFPGESTSRYMTLRDFCSRTWDVFWAPRNSRVMAYAKYLHKRLGMGRII